MRVVFFWEAGGLSLDRANPYAGLLARALARHDVELVAGYANGLTADWLHANQGQVDVLHFNWPNTMYDAPDLPGRLERSAELIHNIALARSLGYKVVWTVHNLYPHETISHDLDRIVQVALAGYSTALIAHCHHARDLVRTHFCRDAGVFVIPHGHFIDPYPNTVTQAEARARLDIPSNNFVYLFFGNVRPYKGIENFLQTFASLPGGDLTLVLAAKIYTNYGEELTRQAAGIDPRIRVHDSRFFPNADLQLYFNAADVVVLPFLNVLTSGSTITALGFSRPVIVPRIGCLPELVDDAVGICYDPTQPGALRSAMAAMRTRDIPAAQRAALERARSLDWDGIALKTIEAYRQ